MALAAATSNYTPTRQALAVASAGQFLPWWLGDSDDFLLVRDIAADRLDALQAEIEGRFGAGPRLVADCRGLGGVRPHPWGWSRYTARLLTQAGLVGDAGIDFDRHRELSHRRTAIAAHSRLPLIEGVAAPDACEARDISEAMECVARWGEVFIKTPWSSSGRGVWRVTADAGAHEQTKIAGAIRRQGSVVVQRAYDKAQDFAMLFDCDPLGAHFLGYSLFFTGSGAGAYAGNRIMTDDAIEAYLSATVAPGILPVLRDEVAKALGKTLGGAYSGPVGVDMLVTADGTVVPFIEINLRYTMGFVAHAIAARGLAGQSAGRILTLSEGFMGLSRNDLM